MDFQKIFSDRKVVFACATLCCFLWGSAYPAIKIGYELLSIERSDIASQLVFAGWRFVFAGLVLLVFAHFTGLKVFGFTRRQAGEIAILGLWQTGLQYVFFYVGVANATGVKASIMNATGVFFSVLLAHFIYQNDKLSPLKALGCVLGFIGVMVVNFKPGALDLEFSLMGEGFVVIAAFVLSAAVIFGKRLSQNMNAIVMTGWQLGIGGVALTVVGYISGGHMGPVGPEAVALLAYMVLLSSVAFALWGILMKFNPVGLVATFQFLIPVAGVLLSGLFLGETILEAKNLMALVLVCVGIWLVTRTVRAK
ncbi:DMT family transporter [Asticcacaulis tiandongensis]|uniref:DMT family transporter n=1 Tax=Asticcacaulis tiandongensis TaxID=2565365 RepID=UPI0011280AA7|nr:DMT family transporter [Asticcacaulis tiandongensis]